MRAWWLLAPGLAVAGDTWTEVRPGIDLLHRTTDTQDYHVVLVDLTRPELSLRATSVGENGQRTSSFAAAVGAVVAINGDLWDADNWSAYEPLGLAVGAGWKWREDTSSPVVHFQMDDWKSQLSWISLVLTQFKHTVYSNTCIYLISNTVRA